MTAYDSLLDAVGGTPLVRLRRITAGLAATVYVKLEYLNPGGSVKDRAARWMLLEAIRTGVLAPGGTIVEGTSGNTGIGLAQAAAQLGHPLVVVVPDKIATEKISTLRAYGAHVVITGSGFPREHPQSVRSIAHRIVDETPGAWLADQFDNPDNPRAHRESTGPEIWADTDGDITHLVAGVGTGGTITGTGEFLKAVSKNRVTVIGADPLGSTYSGGDGSPFFVEASGHYWHPETLDDVWPQSFHTEVVDRFERVSDRESIHTLLRLARLEGILAGGSAGLVLAAALRTAQKLGPDAVVVALLPDSGRAYLSRYLDEDWLRRFGFVDRPVADVPGLDAAGPLVLDTLEAAGVAVPGAEGPDSTVTVGDRTLARDAVRHLADAVASGRLDPATPVPVVLSRPRRDLAPAVSEVLGTTDLATLRSTGPRVPVGDVARPSLPTIGTGELVTDALKRWPDDVEHAVVLRDGRLIAVVPRKTLLRTTGTVGRPSQVRHSG